MAAGFGQRLEHAHCGGDHLRPNAITGKKNDVGSFHLANDCAVTAG